MHSPGADCWDSKTKVHTLEVATRRTFVICISMIDNLLISIVNDKNVCLLVNTRHENKHDEYCIGLSWVDIWDVQIYELTKIS